MSNDESGYFSFYGTFAAWIRRFIGDSAPEVSGIEYIESAMRYYRGTQLSHDGPMKALLEANNQLHKRVTDLEERFATSQKSDATLK